MRALFLGLLLCASVGVQAQTVEAIAFDGLNRLKPDFLAHFLDCQVGQPVDSAQSVQDCLVLRRLPAVFHAHVRWEERDGKLTQVYFIDEVFTLLPYANVGQGGAVSSRTVQLGVAEFNAFGRGVWLTADYQYKELHSVSLGGMIPYIGGRPWNLSLTAKHWNTVEPLYFGADAVRYHYRNRLVQVGLEREFAFRTRVGARVAVFDETYTQMETGAVDVAPEYAYFEKSLLQFYTVDQHIDWHFFYLNGTEVEFRGTTVLNDILPEERFYQGDLIAKAYRHKRERWNSAYRLTLGLATNNESPYAPYVFDSQLNVRGAGDRVARGTAGLFATAEWRWTAFDRDWWALQLVGYSDVGWLRTAGKARMDEQPEWFGGGGVRVHAKRFYNAVLRVDYGASPITGTHGLTFGLGQFF